MLDVVTSEWPEYYNNYTVLILVFIYKKKTIFSAEIENNITPIENFLY